MDTSNGFFALAGTLLAFLFSLAKDIINNRNQINLEKLRLHDKDKIDAYKRLFVFNRKLLNSCFPLADDKKGSFKYIMSKYFKDKIELDYPYFDYDIMEVLDKFEDRYVCMTEPELIAEVIPEEERDFFENKLFTLLQKL